jgi:pimeloyl-ACP methyl ester carboxylesterase
MLFFTFRGFQIEYTTFGEGSIPVLAFHGFGRRAEDFKSFVSACRRDEYLVAINLFAHEQSRWPQDRLLTDSLRLDEYAEMMHAFLVHLASEKFALMGYSMGGRVALVTLQLFSERITRLVLMASDGLKTNHLANFSTGTQFGRALHRSINARPHLLLKSADLARRIRLIDKKMHRFVHVHMGSKMSREQVYAAWHIYRYFKPDLPQVAQIINDRALPCVFIFGAYDSVIKAELGERFARMLQHKDALVILPVGHQLMDEACRWLVQAEGAPLRDV